MKNIKHIDKSIQKHDPGIGLLAAWGCLVMVVFFGLSHSIFDPDLWWHLAAGREMLINRIFLWRDVFSHTLNGAEWTNFEWASQITMFLIYKAFGYWGFFWGQVFLGLISWGLIIWGARTMGLKGAMLFLVSVVSFKIIQPRLNFRPEIISLIFFPLIILLVMKAREAAVQGQLSWKAKKSLGLLFTIGVVWNNFHAGFVYGWGFLVLLWAGSIWAGEKLEFRRYLEKAIVLFSLAFLINPHGPFIVGVLAEHLFQLRDNMKFIQEWNAAWLHPAPFFWGALAATGLLIIYALLPRKKSLRLFVPVAAIFSVWGIVSFRNTYFLGFIFPLLIGQYLSTVSWQRTLTNNRIRFGLWLAGALIALLNIVSASPFPKNPISWWRFPTGACEFIERENIRGYMFNSYWFGGFIEWTLGKDRPVFVDGRYLFQPLSIEMAGLAEKTATAPDFNQNEWAKFLGIYGVDYAIVDYLSTEEVFFRPGVPFPFTVYNGMFPRETWALVFWDDAAMVYLKRTSAFQPLIAKLEYRILRPANFEQMKVLVDSGLLAKKEVQAELDRHTREVGWSIRRTKFLELLIQRGES